MNLNAYRTPHTTEPNTVYQMKVEGL